MDHVVKTSTLAATEALSASLLLCANRAKAQIIFSCPIIGRTATASFHLSGGGDSRIYSIEVHATDASGNQSEMQTVTVPTSPGSGKQSLDFRSGSEPYAYAHPERPRAEEQDAGNREEQLWLGY